PYAKSNLEQNHKQQERQRDYKVGDPHHHLINTAAYKSGGSAVQNTIAHINQRRQQANKQGNSRASHQTRQHVTPQIISPQRMKAEQNFISDAQRVHINRQLLGAHLVQRNNPFYFNNQAQYLRQWL